MVSCSSNASERKAQGLQGAYNVKLSSEKKTFALLLFYILVFLDLFMLEFEKCFLV